MPLPTSMATIAETEAAMGVSFPASFKLHMCRSNGGEVHLAGEEWWLFPFRDTTSRETIRRSAGDIRHETASALGWSGFPADGVAIAHDGSGGVLFLRRDGDRLRDDVWVYDHGEVRLALDDVARLWAREGS